MAMHDRKPLAEATVPITGRRLTLPDGPIFNLHRAADSDYELGEFRAWAGYKTLGVDEATLGLAHFQHVVSFAGTQAAGRTGIHAHFAHAHIVIPTSGRGVFSYDGLVTEAVPGDVIVQHGGTVHDQFSYSYVAGSDADNRRTPLSIEPASADAPEQSFGFLELFVPRSFANVEIIPPDRVSPADQRTAWDHPYHAPGARFVLQKAEAPGGAYRPVATRADFEARDAETWDPSGGLVATWIIRPASTASAAGPAVRIDVPGEQGGLEILFMVGGSARFHRADGEALHLGPGDTLTCSQGLVGEPVDMSPDMRLIKIFIAARAQLLRERTPEEIARLEALGPDIISRREVRPEGDTRPVNVLREA
jgi:mannose-6-phosphate isomerase-like protein (cupin superfamily)